MAIIGTLYTFVANTKAKASEINKNFLDIKTSVNACYTLTGALSDLSTSVKTSLVNAINELVTNLAAKMGNDGSVDFINPQAYATKEITGATNATPIVLTIVGHGRSTGDRLHVLNVGGNTAANGNWTITKLTDDTLSLDSSVGNGAYTSGGTAYILAKENEELVSKVQMDKAITDNTPSVPTDVFSALLLHIQDKKTANTAGGTFTSGAWRTRDLNTVITNEITGASLGTNVITLPAGTYFCIATAPANAVNGHKARLRKTNGTAETLLIGTSADARNGIEYNHNCSLVNGRFTITEESTIELQHYCTVGYATTGFGIPNNIDSLNEIYSEIMIWKAA